MNADRAQSEVVGNVLLVGIIVLVASTVGLAIVGGIGTDEETRADTDEPAAPRPVDTS